MTEEQRFLFDLNGFLILEDVLDAAECEELSRQIYLMHFAQEQLPELHRTVPGGPLARLIDHPKIVPILHALLGPHIRMEYGYVLWREKGKRHPLDLHQGGPMPEPNLRYQFVNGQIFSGLLRVVFEMKDVGPGDGGTAFLAGSHKSNFPVPESHCKLDRDQQSPFLHHVSCPAGSAVIFTENVGHGGPPWNNPDHPRVSAFYSYNHVGMQFHRPPFRKEVIESLTPERQAFFRDVWLYDQESDLENHAQE